MEWMGTPQFRALLQIVEPFEYRTRLMPKMLLNAAGDEFLFPVSRGSTRARAPAKHSGATCQSPRRGRESGRTRR